MPENYEERLDEIRSDPYRDRSADLTWLDMTKDDGTPLDDEEIPILDEPPFVTQVRMMEGGPYYILPDSGEQVPTDFFAHIDLDSVREGIEAANARSEEVTPEGKAILPEAHVTHLERGGPAAAKLLTVLQRGIDATTPEFEEAVHQRMSDAGLL
jgi:hypothetical protein